MFSYAASYFGNAAQYDFARLYLKGTSRDDFRHGARWLALAARKGQHQAQALLVRCCSMATVCRRIGRLVCCG
jgi:uncharacterized protein